MSKLEIIVRNRVWPAVNIGLIGMVLFLVSATCAYQICRYLAA